MPYRNLLCVLLVTGLAACAPEPEAEAPAVADNGAAASSASADTPGGWRTLFDGASLDGWNAIGDANWELSDDTVRANGGNGFLVSDASYADFDLSLEFWVTPDANSGVFLRCMTPLEISATSCYEANVYDTRPDPTYRTGGIVEVAAPMRTLNAGGRWNRFEISMTGPRLQVTLNDVMMVDVEDDKLRDGPIALQYGAGTVMFRNVRVRTR